MTTLDFRLVPLNGTSNFQAVLINCFIADRTHDILTRKFRSAFGGICRGHDRQKLDKVMRDCSKIDVELLRRSVVSL